RTRAVDSVCVRAAVRAAHARIPPDGSFDGRRFSARLTADLHRRCGSPFFRGHGGLPQRRVTREGARARVAAAAGDADAVVAPAADVRAPEAVAMAMVTAATTLESVRRAVRSRAGAVLLDAGIAVTILIAATSWGT